MDKSFLDDNAYIEPSSGICMLQCSGELRGMVRAIKVEIIEREANSSFKFCFEAITVSANEVKALLICTLGAENTLATGRKNLDDSAKSPQGFSWCLGDRRQVRRLLDTQGLVGGSASDQARRQEARARPLLRVCGQ